MLAMMAVVLVSTASPAMAWHDDDGWYDDCFWLDGDLYCEVDF